MASNNEFRGAPGLLILGFAIVLIVLAAHAFSQREHKEEPGESAALVP
jgi:hypothetical protein